MKWMCESIKNGYVRNCFNVLFLSMSGKCLNIIYAYLFSLLWLLYICKFCFIAMNPKSMDLKKIV